MTRRLSYEIAVACFIVALVCAICLAFVITHPPNHPKPLPAGTIAV